MGAVLPHVKGDPAHVPVQQSPAELQAAPSDRHGAVQTGTPPGLATHWPRQHSPSTVHGVPGSRHPPGPGSQRPVAMSQTPEQQPMPASPPVQPSPDGRQTVLESNAQAPLTQESEQQSWSWAHDIPTMVQIAPPHVLPWQASEQQSDGWSQCDPSDAQ
jgi:hypothetical protein